MFFQADGSESECGFPKLAGFEFCHAVLHHAVAVSQGQQKINSQESKWVIKHPWV